MSEHRPTQAEREAEAHADMALHRAVLTDMTARGVAEEVLEQQHENVALAAGTAELLRHGEPGHDCVRLGCRVDEQIRPLFDMLAGVPIGWCEPSREPDIGGGASGASPDEGAAGRRTATIHISLLGGFGVTRDGIACELPEAEQRLVALVALRRRMGRRWAAERLAPRVAPAEAVARLHEALAGLRLAGLDMIDDDGRVLSLSSGVTFDAGEAEDFSSRLEREGDGPRWSADHDRLLLELLPGWTEFWAEIARIGFEDLFRCALETEMRRLLDGGATAAAVTFAQKVLRADPFRESTLRLLIEARLAEGRDDLARDCYLDFRQKLRDRWGLEPTPAARALVAHLMGDDGPGIDGSPS